MESVAKDNLAQIGTLTTKVVDDLKKRAKDRQKFRIEDCEEFNVVAYVDGIRTIIGFGWMNLVKGTAPRIKIRPEFASVLAGESEPKEAWIFPRDRRQKKGAA